MARETSSRGNGENGILITGENSTNVHVRNNYIGTDVSGELGIPNEGAGIRIEAGAKGNFIGTDLNTVNDGNEGNIIAFNGGVGVRVESGTANAIRQNSIFANNEQGIDLGTAGITANDEGDRRWTPIVGRGKGLNKVWG